MECRMGLRSSGKEQIGGGITVKIHADRALTSRRRVRRRREWRGFAC